MRKGREDGAAFTSPVASARELKPGRYKLKAVPRANGIGGAATILLRIIK